MFKKIANWLKRAKKFMKKIITLLEAKKSLNKEHNLPENLRSKEIWNSKSLKQRTYLPEDLQSKEISNSFSQF